MTEAELRTRAREILLQKCTKANVWKLMELVEEAAPYFGGQGEALKITDSELDILQAEHNKKLEELTKLVN